VPADSCAVFLFQLSEVTVLARDADIIIIGAGASGMAAAAAALSADPSLKVTLLERSDRPGRKILVTGNGRCNLSTQNMDISCYNEGAARYESVFDRFGDDISFFRGLGLLTRPDQEGRIYPMSGQASSVLDALRFAVSAAGAQTVCDTEVTRVERNSGSFSVHTSGGRRFTSAAVIVAAGSPAGQHGYDSQALIGSLRRMDCGFRDFSPALVQLTVRDLPAQLRGTRVRAEASLGLADGRTFRESGEVQFGEGYISGICVMDLSRHYDGESEAGLTLDMCPDMGEGELRAFIAATAASRPETEAASVLSGIVPKAAGETVLRRCCSDIFKRKAGSLTAEETAAAAASLKALAFTVTGKGGFKSAQICTGGVLELDGDTLCSQNVPGLFFCGEIVDVDGRCGGYNLHWAWASGRAAGTAAAALFK
jgi:hypothetical protein